MELNFNINAKEWKPTPKLHKTPIISENLAHEKDKTDCKKNSISKNQTEKVVKPSPIKEMENKIEVTKKKVINFHDDREHLNIVFIGHVDAGKSTMCGQILILTGMADERTVEKYKSIAREKNRESWWIAFIMDTNEEERNKGKTVEVGMANFETDTRRYSILDAPGHKNYVPAMISGASQADIGILVISARKGEFESGFHRGGQTREHSMLAKTLGVTKIIIAVNKMDEETVQWSQTRYLEIVKKTTAFLKQCGFKEKDISSLPLSALCGDGILSPIAKTSCEWHEGPSLFQLLDQQNVHRDHSSPLRLPIQNIYKDKSGVVVMGKIESGVLESNSKLCLMPQNINVKCEKVSIDEIVVEGAKSGENVTMALKGVEMNFIQVGDVLCPSGDGAPSSDVIEAQLYVVELLPHNPVIAKGYGCILHVHTQTVACEIISIKKVIENKKENSKSKRRPKFIKVGQKAIVKLKLSKIVAMETYKRLPKLGRFTLRDEGKTIAIGRVLEVGEKTLIHM